MLEFLIQLIASMGFKDFSSERPPLPHLSPELWELIFLKLPRGKRKLLRLRRTCHYWKNIIDNSSAIRERFHIKFPKHKRICKFHKFFDTYPAPVGNIAIECYSFSLLSNVNLWWSNAGAVATKLCLGRCEFPLELLRHTPKLKSLHLFYVKVVGRETADFKLNDLQELALEYVDPEFLSTIAKIIPDLKIFKLNGAVMDASEAADKDRERLIEVACSLDCLLRMKYCEDDEEHIDMCHWMKLATTNPVLFGKTCFQGVPRVIRQVRMPTTDRERELIRNLRDITVQELTSFVELYPNLEEVAFFNCEAVDDYIVEKVSEMLPKLKKMILKNCYTTIESDIIIQHREEMNHSEVSDEETNYSSDEDYF